MRHYRDSFPPNMREQGEHDRATFNACPHQMLTTNVDEKYLLADSFARALQSCSRQCAESGRCYREWR